ncbi:hypothetical protein ABIF38_005694 [Bradyrhizobium japonicum]|uniref:hypothetical protein n=1 Tax=Bradyrhizobium elkanii TaxID=29448 RepID=UPI00037456ED|nr:hypothetical protein [Bradyrhizobium elkanii]MBP2434768.1 hypothetical protein [Bradyrhizobium elkanii]MCP1731996.1 hypothetical protein [Bradyrhizobium elkanii]MCS3567330.1 hypothetical protein [Bradyrhizobium elkanii]MCS3591185.1 hypothetical protein [Bradyrhizobium elkanii]MCS3620628.1 hypothetical protein [Bradyrhizobium elkanii]
MTKTQARLVKVDRTDARAVAQTRALIKLLYDVHENSRKTPLYQTRKNIRFSELELLFAYQFRDTVLPDDSAGLDCLHIAACHLWHLGKNCGPDAAIREWAAQWAPWLSPYDVETIIMMVEADPRKWTADELGQEMQLPFETRQALGITTIGAFDLDKAGRELRRKRCKKQAEAERRRKRGAQPRAEYLATHSENRTKPWLALGISKRTYQRRKANAKVGTGPCTAK